MIRFAENLNKMITAGLGGALEAPSTEVALGHRIRYMDASGAVANFETNVVASIRSLRVNMQPIQAGSGDPSPENLRPISGRDSVTVWREASYDPSADPALTIPLGQTVYGGTVDVIAGKLTVNWAKIVLNGTQQIFRENWKPQANSVGWIYPYNLTRNVVGTGAVMQNIKCDTLPSMPFNSLQSINGPGIALASNQTYGITVMYPDPSLTTASTINAFLAEHPIDVVYELAEPFDIDLTPASLSTLSGDNTVWSDADSVTLEYPYYEETEGY